MGSYAQADDRPGPRLCSMVAQRRSNKRQSIAKPEPMETDTAAVNGLTNGKTFPKKAASKLNGVPNSPVAVAELKVNNEKVEKEKPKKPEPTLGDRRRQTLDKEKEKMIAASPSASRPTSSDSLVVLLTHGLMAHDEPKLDEVLEKTDLNVIQSTLAELQVKHIVPLLQAIESRLRERRRIDIRPWIRWAQCIFTMHMSYLSSLRTLENDLGGLLDWMRTRTANSARLLALHGKMGVLAEHIEKMSNKELEPLPQPLIVFNTDGIEDSDVEDAESNASEDSESEEEWWDDGGLMRQGGTSEEDNAESDDDDMEERKQSKKRKHKGFLEDSDDGGDSDDDEDSEGSEEEEDQEMDDS